MDTTYGYDPVSRLLSVLHKLGTTTLDGAVYTYDNAGNRLTRADKRTNTGLTYTYDNVYQLKTAKQGTTTKESYTYDLVGNRLSSLGASPYNSSNELTSTPSGSYTYDSNGNRKADPSGAQYSWDFENRLAEVILPGTGGTVNLKYDPFGRRVQNAFTQNGTTTTTDYLYDGANILETINQSGSVLARYVDTLNIDEPLSELISGTTSYYEQDGLGSVSSLSNSAGALANTYTYDSYGKLTASTGAVPNPFQYTGREFDSETGVYEYRVRYYDQTVGRFISEDPVRFKAGTDFYRYVENNPARFTDPSGTDPFQHWPLNGNLWPGFTPQDGVCTTGPFADTMNSRPCIKKCCKEHDDCYTKYNCNFSSFLGGLPFGPCRMCNEQAAACILAADKSPGGGDCKCSK